MTAQEQKLIQELTAALKRQREASEGLVKALVTAGGAALALLDKQREEYDAILTLMTHHPTEEGPIAKRLRAAIAAAKAAEVQ